MPARRSLGRTATKAWLRVGDSTGELDAPRVAGEDLDRTFGNSNGTVYGQAYADLFGANVERMYLDSVADHTTADLYGMVEPKAVALEANLNGFVEWCAQEPTCALRTGDALAVWDRVVAAAGGECRSRRRDRNLTSPWTPRCSSARLVAGAQADGVAGPGHWARRGPSRRRHHLRAAADAARPRRAGW
ncbi:MAG: hypothetical protein V7646_2252 [Pseudonocardia sp.]